MHQPSHDESDLLFSFATGCSSFSSYSGYPGFTNEMIPPAFIGTFKEPEKLEKPEQPVTSIQIIPTNSNP